LHTPAQNSIMGWIANAPDLEAFSAHGETPEETVRQVRVALASLLVVARERGLVLPKPSEHENSELG